MEKPALIRFASRSAVALALASPALPVSAQSYSYSSASKSEAILGGQSKLAAILAQQSGQPVQQASVSPAGYGASVLRAAMPIYRPAISLDRPDVFGSVALPIARSSLDRRWKQVSQAAFA